ncbi:hypothetical protein [Pseudomonas putida]|uniref:Peptidase C1A papain C-terminal domain-containing protein n=1 Tax=Pseudomonas putida TaxID=303 RepID=A0A1Q9R6I9_PSEPU|nr:hypothetical protein [Pseudomonas putida]OLS63023.1 hypothetical protein PSEMO_19590 [Pseudomonas putida]
MNRLLPIILCLFPLLVHAKEEYVSVEVYYGEEWTVKESKVLDNMPAPTSQQGFGFCYGHSAATVFNYHNCQAYKENCSTLEPNRLVSPLGVAVWGQELPKNNDGHYSFSNPPELTEGGSSIGALFNTAVIRGSAPDQSCIDERAFLGDLYVEDGSITEASVASQRKLLGRLQSFYRKYKGQFATTADIPAPVMAELRQIVPGLDNPELAKGLNGKKFGEFFYRVVIPDRCKRVSNHALFETDMKLVEYPNGEKLPHTVKGTMAVIRKAIDGGSPLILEVQCAIKKVGAKGCRPEDAHSFVVYGYARLCLASGKCSDGLRLRGSAGEKADALDRVRWYDAEPLIDAAPKKGVILGWLIPRPKKAQ